MVRRAEIDQRYFLYLDRGLFLYAGLFAIYLAICAAGFLSWRRSWLAEAARAQSLPLAENR